MQSKHKSSNIINYSEFTSIINPLTTGVSIDAKASQVILAKAKLWLEVNCKIPGFDINKLILFKKQVTRNSIPFSVNPNLINGYFHLLPCLTIEAETDAEVLLLNLVLKYKPSPFAPTYLLDTQQSLAHLAVFNQKKSDAVVRVLAKNNMDLTALTPKGHSVAECAAEYNNYVIMQALRELKVDIFSIGKNGFSPVELAYLEDSKEVVEYFMTLPSEEIIFRGDLLLIVFAEENKLNEIQNLIRHFNVDVNCQDKMGFTALMQACSYGYHKVAKYLLEECKAKTNITNIANDTALSLAIKHGHVDCVELFSIQDFYFEKINTSALILALKCSISQAGLSRTIIVQMLLNKIKEAKCDSSDKERLLQLTDWENYTALHLALDQPVHIVHSLLSCLDNLNMKGGPDNLTPLELAAVKDNHTIFELLLQNEKIDKDYEKLISLMIKHNAKESLVKLIIFIKKPENKCTYSMYDISHRIVTNMTIKDKDKTAFIKILFVTISQEQIRDILALTLKLAIEQKNINLIKHLLLYAKQETLSQENCNLLIDLASQLKLYDVTFQLRKLYPEKSQDSTESESFRFFPANPQKGQSGFAYVTERFGLEDAKELKQQPEHDELKQETNEEKPAALSCSWFEGLLKSEDKRMHEIEVKNNKTIHRLFVPDQLYVTNPYNKPGPIPDDFFDDKIIHGNRIIGADRISFTKKTGKSIQKGGLKLLKKIKPPSSITIGIADKIFKINPSEVKWFEYVKKGADRPLIAQIPVPEGGGALYLVVDFIKGGFHNSNPKISDIIELRIKLSSNEEDFPDTPLPSIKIG